MKAPDDGLITAIIITRSPDQETIFEDLRGSDAIILERPAVR